MNGLICTQLGLVGGIGQTHQSAATVDRLIDLTGVGAQSVQAALVERAVEVSSLTAKEQSIQLWVAPPPALIVLVV
jgi:hypothetical protein